MADDIADENWTGSPIEVRFVNFDTGHSNLRSGHYKTISDRIVPILRDNPSAWVDLIGYASRLGFAKGDTHERNKQLSAGRCGAVQREIRRLIGSARFNVIDPEGDVDSTTGAQDDAYWRAVKLRIFGAKAQPQPGPKPEAKWVCGPDVADQVAAVWTKVQTDFAGLSFEDKIIAGDKIFLPFQKPGAPLELPDNPLDIEKWKDMARQFADINSWDTLPLFQYWSGWLRKPPIYDPATKGPCATPSSDVVTGTDGAGNPRKADQSNNADPLHESDECCANTVNVGGKCWLNGTVNYGMLGIMVRLCSDFASTDPKMKFSPRRLVYTLEWAKMLIRAYKRFGANPEGAVLPIAWTEATFHGGPRAVPGIPGNRPKCACTGPCKGDVVTWDYVWEPHHSRPPGLPLWAEGPKPGGGSAP